MKRRTFIGSSTFSLTALTAETEKAEKSEKSENLVRTPAVIMAPRHDGAEIVWAVSRLSLGKVEWRDGAGNTGIFDGTGYGFSPQNSKVLKVKISGLTSNTKYEIRALTEAIDGAAEKVEDPWKSFRTLADESHPDCHFVVWNDTHENADTIKTLLKMTPSADFFLWNGDTSNNFDREEQIAPVVLNPADCDISDGRPLFLTLGNHDIRGKYAFKISDYTASPSDIPYYAFRYGPVGFIFLSTGEDKPDDHPSFGGRVAFQKNREEQAVWLKETIARPDLKDAPFRVVFCHIPLRLDEEIEKVDYANGGYDHYARSSRDLWHESLVNWGAQIIISGHAHQQNWIPADDKFPYAQLIGGGPREEQARLIEGKIMGDELNFTLRDLSGKITFETKIAKI